MLTKIDIAALRHADDLVIHLNHRNPDGRVLAVKRKARSAADPFATDIEHAIPAAVELYCARGQAELKAGDAQCFALVGIYHGQAHHVSCILKTLRTGDEITFSFWPDAHTNGYVAMAGLHGDALYLYVRRNGQTIARWELDSCMAPANSARMCRGIPNSEHYARDAAEARKVA